MKTDAEFSVSACGHPFKPDIKDRRVTGYYAVRSLVKGYAWIDIACLTPMSLEQIRAALRAQGDPDSFYGSEGQ